MQEQLKCNRLHLHCPDCLLSVPGRNVGLTTCYFREDCAREPQGTNAVSLGVTISMSEKRHLLPSREAIRKASTGTFTPRRTAQQERTHSPRALDSAVIALGENASSL